MTEDKRAISDSIFKQIFIFCALCHQRATTGNSLFLTSCTHILSHKYLPKNGICPICKTYDFSTISLIEKQTLPNDVNLFFQPLTTLIENIHDVSVFQNNGLNEQIQYFQAHCIKMRERVARQQQLLYQAKKELDKIPFLKQKIQYLEESIKNLIRNVTTTK